MDGWIKIAQIPWLCSTQIGPMSRSRVCIPTLTIWLPRSRSNDMCRGARDRGCHRVEDPPRPPNHQESSPIKENASRSTHPSSYSIVSQRARRKPPSSCCFDAIIEMAFSLLSSLFSPLLFSLRAIFLSHFCAYGATDCCQKSTRTTRFSLVVHLRCLS